VLGGVEDIGPARRENDSIYGSIIPCDFWGGFDGFVRGLKLCILIRLWDGRRRKAFDVVWRFWAEGDTVGYLAVGPLLRQTLSKETKQALNIYLRWSMM
jgi:hypothetical protein